LFYSSRNSNTSYCTGTFAIVLAGLCIPQPTQANRANEDEQTEDTTEIEEVSEEAENSVLQVSDYDYCPDHSPSLLDDLKPLLRDLGLMSANESELHEWLTEAPVEESQEQSTQDLPVEIDWDAIAERCQPPKEGESVVYSNDFKWGYGFEEMGERFEEMYASGKRLKDRAYYDAASERFVLPLSEAWGKQTVASKRLVENIRLHIEKALASGYADYPFFPDMGHTHLFIPQEHWDSVYKDCEVSEFGERFTLLFDDPKLKLLYHTAEQLQVLDEDDNLLDDKHLQWRFSTRNLVGDNDGAGITNLLHEPDSKANTSRDLEGHQYFGSGFNITATKEGCFPYVHDGKAYYFDISMTDLPRDPDIPTDINDYY
jgi:hypothetical protein